MTTEATNYQWPQGAVYQTGDRGTEALGVKDTVLPVPDNIVAAENFEIDPISGSGTWLTTSSLPHTGSRCLRSAVIGDSQSTIYTFTVPALATSLRLWHRVSSEVGFDFFRIYKNSVSVPNQLFQLSGLLNTWQLFTVSLSGITSIIVEYSKDSSASAGLDAAFIDDIEWYIPGTAAIQNFEPYHLDTNNRVKVTLLGETLAVTGGVSVLNFPAVAHLNCSTDSIEICNDVGSPITVSGTVAATQSTSPWVVSGTVAATQSGAWTTSRTWDLDFASDQVDVSGSVITVNQGTSPWVVSGTVNIGTIPEVEIKNDAGNPVPISGTVTITDGSGSITVDGTVAVTQSTSPWVVSGTVAVTQSTSPWVVSGTVNIGTIPEVEIKNDTGNPVPVSGTITVNQGTSPWVTDVSDRTARQVGLVDIRKASTASTPAQTSTSSSAAVVLSSNASRRSFIIQNTGTVPVKLTFDGTNPTQTAYHLCLSACTVADDGTGAIYMDDQWTGDIRAISASSGTIVITEVT